MFYNVTERMIVSTDYHMNDLKRLLQSERVREVAIDVETSGHRDGDSFNPWSGYLVGVGLSVCMQPEIPIGVLAPHELHSFYIPMVSNDPAYAGVLWTPEQVGKHLSEANADNEIDWVLFHAKFDIEWLEIHCGMQFTLGTFRDPMIEMWLANRDGVDSFGLKELTKHFYPHEAPPVKFETLLGRGKTKKKIDDVDLNTVASYCMADCENTLRVGYHTLQAIHAEGDAILRIYTELELPLLRLLADMEMRGVKLDRDRLDSLALELHEKAEDAQERLDAFAPINWNSTQQVAAALTGAGVILPAQYTATGKQQLTAAILNDVKDQHPIVETLLEYRGLKKITDTYISAFYQRIDSNFRIHCQFRQSGTRTGRLSCGDPNLQNIPTEAKEHMPERVRHAYAELRKLFIGEDKLIVADLSQIEFRMAAHFSKDPVLVKAYLSGHDFHEATATAVTAGNRRLAKNINFGYLYGQRAKGLVALTGMPLNDAKKFYAQFERSFRTLALWDISQKSHARMRGYAETILGRRRYLPKIKSTNWAEKGEAERQAINTIIQGSAADYLKLAMLRIDKQLRQMGVYMVLAVHDELVFDTDGPLTDDQWSLALDIIQHEMEHAIALTVPVKTDPKIVSNWAEGK